VPLALAAAAMAASRIASKEVTAHLSATLHRIPPSKTGLLGECPSGISKLILILTQTPLGTLTVILVLRISWLSTRSC